MSWEDWLQGRRARRETGNRVAPEIIRRSSSSSDPRLRALFNGERGLPFKQTDELHSWRHKSTTPRQGTRP
jgi:hypothetical protein